MILPGVILSAADISMSLRLFPPFPAVACRFVWRPPPWTFDDTIADRAVISDAFPADDSGEFQEIASLLKKSSSTFAISASEALRKFHVFPGIIYRQLR